MSLSQQVRGPYGEVAEVVAVFRCMGSRDGERDLGLAPPDTCIEAGRQEVIAHTDSSRVK